MDILFDDKDIIEFYESHSLELLEKLLSPHAALNPKEPNYHDNPVLPALSVHASYSTMIKFKTPKNSEIYSAIERIVKASDDLVRSFRQTFEGALKKEDISALALYHFQVYKNISEDYAKMDRKFQTKDGISGEGLKWANTYLAELKEAVRTQLIIANIMYNKSASSELIRNIENGSLRQEYQEKIFN